MQANKAKNTKPELQLRKALRCNGYGGYRLHWKVVGKPDICYPGKKIAIFVNGCFWHRCPFCNPPMPETNIDFWKEKFSKNVLRDKKNTNQLKNEGWIVLVVWECEIKNSLDDVVARIVATLTGH